MLVVKVQHQRNCRIKLERHFLCAVVHFVFRFEMIQLIPIYRPVVADYPEWHGAMDGNLVFQPDEREADAPLLPQLCHVPLLKPQFQILVLVQGSPRGRF